MVTINEGSIDSYFQFLNDRVVLSLLGGVDPLQHLLNVRRPLAYTKTEIRHSRSEEKAADKARKSSDIQ